MKKNVSEEVSLNTQIILNEALKRGYKVEILSNNEHFAQISDNEKKIYIRSTNLPINSTVSYFIAGKKEVAKLIFKKNDLPTPSFYLCKSMSEVKKCEKKLVYPLVVKPTNLMHGYGVITNIKNSKSLLKYSKEAIKKYGTIIVEEFVEGEDYRLLVIDGKYRSTIHRVAAYVIGNGKDTVRNLIEKENKNPLRGSKQSKPLTIIKIDDETEFVLKRQKYSLETIPDIGEKVIVKNTANMSKGGMTFSITNKVHKDYIKLSEDASKAIGMKFAGVDIITKDITQSINKSPGYLIEINSSPSIEMHQYPYKGKGDNIGKYIVDMLEKYCFKTKKNS